MSYNAFEILQWMSIILFVMGGISFLAGTIILLFRTTNKDIRTLAVQTNNLAQKGIIDGIAGLVGNASSLLNATNQLVRTTTGIGAFFIFISILLIGISLLILFQIL